ncbi:unnamed protein product [Somion occarium]|uniref:Uncharacterized protein n=1 Tax=Somion occarium TaxID=3059160 RepID=A0ABP1CP97_9APHY
MLAINWQPGEIWPLADHKSERSGVLGTLLFLAMFDSGTQICYQKLQILPSRLVHLLPITERANPSTIWTEKRTPTLLLVIDRARICYPARFRNLVYCNAFPFEWRDQGVALHVSRNLYHVQYISWVYFLRSTVLPGLSCLRVQVLQATPLSDVHQYGRCVCSLGLSPRSYPNSQCCLSAKDQKVGRVAVGMLFPTAKNAISRCLNAS